MFVKLLASFILLCCLCWNFLFFEPSRKLVWDRTRKIRGRKPKSRHFHVFTSREIYSTLVNLSKSYPQFSTLTSAQAQFRLPAAGDSSDCPYELGSGCKNWIITIEDKLAHPKGYASFASLPEVFISGALHGDERVGPTAAVETARLLLLAVDCEAKQYLPRSSTEAQSCRQQLLKMGIRSAQRQRLARLVNSRRIVIVPTTNALGYYQDERTENGIDPNRDFPFNNDPHECMQTIAARTVNELFTSHIFQLSLTFHAGMEVVAFEWGNPLYGTNESPDHIAQAEIAAAYSAYGGQFGTTPFYSHGKLNDLVYPVHGGMEDWGYAGSWDSSLVQPCTPNTYGGYSKSKTIYNAAVLRAFNMLVEASDDKTPSANTLGSDYDLLNPNSFGNGHVPRNIRLCLFMVEIVEPFLHFTKIGDKSLPSSMIPTKKTLFAAKNSHDMYRTKNTASVQWTVGGCFQIDDTHLIYGTEKLFSDFLNQASFPSEKTIQSLLADNSGEIKYTKPQQGEIRIPGTSSVFSSFLDLSEYTHGEKIICIALAKVDQGWSQKPIDSVPPGVKPQSHIVNARTDPTWRHENAGKTVIGRLYWVSPPLSIQVK